MSTYTSRELRRLSLRIAGEAAGFLRDLREDEGEVLERLPGRDTTKADWEAEGYIIDLLKQEGIRGLVVTEERGVLELGSDDITVVVDPLDGSTNYVLGIPWCAVSIGFAPKRSQARLSDVVAGTIHSVFLHVPYSFSRGEGVFVGEERVERSMVQDNFRRTGRNTIILYLDFVEELQKVEALLQAMRREHGVMKARCLGSASLELAMVAIGRVGYFIDLRPVLRNVDVAVAFGLLRELGGAYSNTCGEPIDVGLDRVYRIESVIATSRSEDLGAVRRLLTNTAWRRVG